MAVPLASLKRFYTAALMSVCVAICAAVTWAFDQTSTGNAAGSWSVTEVTGGLGYLPVKVGSILLIEPDGYAALDHRFGFKIGIAGRGLCGWRCFTIYSITTARSYRAVLSPDSGAITVTGDSGFVMNAVRQAAPK